MTPAWLNIEAAAEYAGVSPEWLRRQLKNPTHPLPAKRVGGNGARTGMILINRAHLERWLRAWPDYTAESHAERVANEMIRAWREGRK